MESASGISVAVVALVHPLLELQVHLRVGAAVVAWLRAPPLDAGEPSSFTVTSKLDPPLDEPRRWARQLAGWVNGEWSVAAVADRG